ncbi:MAG: hypothetical protein DRJ69_07140 [Thermoprotei archaeon]|nr:MAG: hypothetical protein DRJ69_07140 [Thermoprotei archaeon]
MARSSVKRSDLPLLVEEVRVEILKQVPELPGGRPLHMLPVGAVVEVPRWLASILEEEGYVKVLDGHGMDLQTLSKLSWREERSPSPVEVDELLYPKIGSCWRGWRGRPRPASRPTQLSARRRSRCSTSLGVGCRSLFRRLRRPRCLEGYWRT